MTGDRVKAFFLGLRMIAMSWAFWPRSLGARLRGCPLFGAPLGRVRIET